MIIDKFLIDSFVKTTERAAYGASIFKGKNDKIAADQAAVDEMRKELNSINMKGKIVIGEGELDEAPMLYINEEVGTRTGDELDIAVDPLEGTNFVANNLPGGLSVIAVAEKDNLFNAPETYMEKLASGSDVPSGLLDLDFPIERNIKNLADFKKKDLSDLTVCILERPRHKNIIDKLNNLKVNLKLITDGDVSGALLVTNKKYKVDLFLGIGGGPEGVLAASALDAYGCNFQGRFIFKTEENQKRAKDMGVIDLDKKYELKEIIRGDSIFCATGITDGDLVKGIYITNNLYTSETFVTHKKSQTKEIIKKEHTT